MVTPKITVCPVRGDEFGYQFNSNCERYGFFANESQDSKYFESGRNRSLKVRKESTGGFSNRSDCRPKSRNNNANLYGHDQLFRGKGVLAVL